MSTEVFLTHLKVFYSSFFEGITLAIPFLLSPPPVEDPKQKREHA